METIDDGVMLQQLIRVVSKRHANISLIPTNTSKYDAGDRTKLRSAFLTGIVLMEQCRVLRTVNNATILKTI